MSNRPPLCITNTTHLFNAMPALHHRQPALVGAVLAEERLTMGLIPDGIHVHPSLVKDIWRLAGEGRLNLVTDADLVLLTPDFRVQTTIVAGRVVYEANG